MNGEETFVSLKPEWHSVDIRLSRKAALTTATDPPPLPRLLEKNCFLIFPNSFKTEFSIVIFIYHKPRIADEILNL